MKRLRCPDRLVYREGETVHEWMGTVRANPENRPLRLAALTCQNDYAFPYAPVAGESRET